MTIRNHTLKLVFASEAARLIGVAEQTLRGWENSGKLVPIRIGEARGGVRVYYREEVEAVAAERRVARG